MAEMMVTIAALRIFVLMAFLAAVPFYHKQPVKLLVLLAILLLIPNAISLYFNLVGA